MSNEKMREAFEADMWRDALEEGAEPNLTRGPNGDYVQPWVSGAWRGYQAATTATQRDAMAVAEAVRQKAWQMWGRQDFHDHPAEVDLAAIVQAVRPGKRGEVNQQMLTALPFAILPDELKALNRFHECVTDGEGYDVPKGMMKRLAEIGLVRRVTANIYEHTTFGLSVLNGDFDAAIAAAEAAQPCPHCAGDGFEFTDKDSGHQVSVNCPACLAQPSSAQPHGEPVAWYRWSEMFKKRLFTDVTPTEELAWIPLYTAQPAPACSVPEGWKLVPVEPTVEMSDAGAKYDRFNRETTYAGLYRAMLAAAPKGGA